MKQSRKFQKPVAAVCDRRKAMCWLLVTACIFISDEPLALAQPETPDDVDSEAIVEKVGDKAAISVFIVNDSKERFQFCTGSAGGGGKIVGPNYARKGKFDGSGTPPTVFLALRFRSGSGETEVNGVAIGGPTRRAMRPAVFAVEASQRKLYCQFEVPSEQVAGEFVSGFIAGQCARTSADTKALSIPIRKVLFGEGPKPHKRPDFHWASAVIDRRYSLQH